MVNGILKVFLVLVLLSLPTSGQNSQQHLICKNIENVFSDAHDDSAVSHSRRIQARTGKRGPAGVKGKRGLPGAQGQPGSPAVVDYERIFQAIEEKHREGMREMESRFQELRRNITQLETEPVQRSEETTTTATTTAMTTNQARSQRCKEENGLPLDGKCYTIGQASHSLNFNQASQKCISRGTVVAEIDSMAQQQAIHDFFRSKLPYNAHLWVAMTYQSSDRNLRFRSGKEVSIDQFKWYSSCPCRSLNNVVIVIRYGFQNSDEGMIIKPASQKLGVLCEKAL